MEITLSDKDIESICDKLQDKIFRKIISMQATGTVFGVIEDAVKANAEFWMKDSNYKSIARQEVLDSFSKWSEKEVKFFIEDIVRNLFKNEKDALKEARKFILKAAISEIENIANLMNDELDETFED